MSWPSVKRPTTSPSSWCASGELPRRLRLRAARSSREVAPWRPATSSARRKQASARSPSVPVARCRQQDLAFQPMELCLPPALAGLLDPIAGLGQPLAGRLDAASTKARLGEKGQEVRLYDANTGTPPAVQALLHQRDALGLVSACSHHPTLEEGGPGDPEWETVLGAEAAQLAGPPLQLRGFPAELE